MNLPYEILVSSEEETALFCKKLSKLIKPGDLIVMNGNLGAGKTFIVKKTVAFFNIDDAASPTFSIINEYSGDLTVYHIDFYRIEKEVELFDIGIETYLYDREAVKFVEWGEMFPDILPKNHYILTIEWISANKRKIRIAEKQS